MSFFRPAKSKPRQFNYVPRYYDPVKEERDRRRRELHGTSVETDNEGYVPGRYIRTQRDARDAAREQSAGDGFRKVRNLALVAVVVVVAILLLYPRFIAFVERANDEELAKQSEMTVVAMPGDSLTYTGITLHEQHADIDFREFKSLTPESLNEIEEYNNSIRSINIYSDDVKIENGKRVE